MPELARGTLIVETQDFIEPTITDLLVARLQETHDVSVGREGGRDPNALPILQRLNSLDRWLAVCEFRPETMRWIYARARRAIQSGASG